MFRLLKSDDGFSLLELLVAMAILSLAVIPMIATQSTALRSANRLTEKTLARMVGENALTDFITSDISPGFGTIRGSGIQAGMDFDWQAHIGPIRGQKILQISLSVSRHGDKKPMYKITGFKKAL